MCNFLHTRFDVRLCAFGMHIHEFNTFQNVQYSWNTSRQTNVHYFIIIIFNRVSCMATINFRSDSFAPKVFKELHRNEIRSWVEHCIDACIQNIQTILHISPTKGLLLNDFTVNCAHLQNVHFMKSIESIEVIHTN